MQRAARLDDRIAVEVTPGTQHTNARRFSSAPRRSVPAKWNSRPELPGLRTARSAVTPSAVEPGGDHLREPGGRQIVEPADERAPHLVALTFGVVLHRLARCARPLGAAATRSGSRVARRCGSAGCRARARHARRPRATLQPPSAPAHRPPAQPALAHQQCRPRARSSRCAIAAREHVVGRIRQILAQQIALGRLAREVELGLLRLALAAMLRARVELAVADRPLLVARSAHVVVAVVTHARGASARRSWRIGSRSRRLLALGAPACGERSGSASGAGSSADRLCHRAFGACGAADRGLRLRRPRLRARRGSGSRRRLPRETRRRPAAEDAPPRRRPSLRLWLEPRLLGGGGCEASLSVCVHSRLPQREYAGSDLDDWRLSPILFDQSRKTRAHGYLGGFPNMGKKISCDR